MNLSTTEFLRNHTSYLIITYGNKVLHIYNEIEWSIDLQRKIIRIKWTNKLIRIWSCLRSHIGNISRLSFFADQRRLNLFAQVRQLQIPFQGHAFHWEPLTFLYFRTLRFYYFFIYLFIFLSRETKVNYRNHWVAMIFNQWFWLQYYIWELLN